MFANPLSQANVQEEFRGNPPGLFEPTFFAGTATPPVFSQGSGNKPPFGYTYPLLAGSPLCPVAPCLDSKGGLTGSAAPIGGIDPNLSTPTAYIFAATLEHRLTNNLVASVLYSGSHTTNLVANGNQAGTVSYGSDINVLPGDLLVNANPTRLNSSFGSISYAQNDRVANYNGITFNLRGRANRFFFDTSYTHSSSKDDAGTGGAGTGVASYPTQINPHQFYGPSPWDVPNRFSLTLNYSLPGLSNDRAVLNRLTGGWGVSATSIYQTGYPLTVVTTAPYNAASFVPGADAHIAVTGDYNADGDNGDYPNVTTYSQGTSRNAYLNTGIFSAGQFTVPDPGSNGNEKPQHFRQPSFSETDASLYKDTRLTEKVNFQLRFEFFNLFNHPNLFVDANLADGTFGKSVSQQLPRWWQIGAKITF
jgi:hypothetical protein